MFRASLWGSVLDKLDRGRNSIMMLILQSISIIKTRLVRVSMCVFVSLESCSTYESTEGCYYNYESTNFNASFDSLRMLKQLLKSWIFMYAYFNLMRMSSMYSSLDISRNSLNISFTSLLECRTCILHTIKHHTILVGASLCDEGCFFSLSSWCISIWLYLENAS